MCMEGENWPVQGDVVCRQRTHPHLNARIQGAASRANS